MGLYSPFKFGKKEYMGYDITQLKGYCRFFEVLEDRDYGANGFTCALFFDGATSTFKELPPPTDIFKLKQYYNLINKWEMEDESQEFSLTPS